MARQDVALKSSKFIMLASVCVVVAALYFAQGVLIPLALAVLLSFMLAPVVRWLEKLRLPRVAAVLTTALLAFAVIGVVGFVVYRQFADLTEHLPEYERNIHEKALAFHRGNGFFSGLRSLGSEMTQMVTGPVHSSTQPSDAHIAAPVPVVVTNTGSTGSASDNGPPVAALEEMAKALFGPLGTAFIVIVFTIFMLLQREDLRDRVLRLVGRGHLMLTTQAMDDAADRVSRYLIMQTVINGTVGLFVAIGLWAIGRIHGTPFPSPMLWGLLAALLRFIPYVGIWLAAATPVLLSLAVFATAGQAAEVLGVYIVIELIAGNVGEPLLFGASTGLATLAILVAAAFWTWLWGPVGLLLSTPLTVCLVVAGKYVPQLEFISVLLGDEPALNPHARIYQRLLAMDTEEALELAEQYATRMPLEQFYDEVLIGVLSMYKQDHVRERLDEERERSVLDGVREIIDDLSEIQKSIQIREKAQDAVDQARAKPSEAGNTATRGNLAAPPEGSRLMLPRGAVVNVVCLPAQDDPDELAAMMLSHLLEIRGYGAQAVSVTHLASEMIEAVEKQGAHIVCISAFPPAAAIHTRYLCKRINGKFSDLSLVAGLWTNSSDLVRTRDRMGCGGQVQVVTTLQQALDQVHQLAQRAMLTSGDSSELRSTPAVAAPH